jgi:diguanylate cyclase (GGDEF)-like protein
MTALAPAWCGAVAVGVVLAVAGVAAQPASAPLPEASAPTAAPVSRAAPAGTPPVEADVPLDLQQRLDALVRLAEDHLDQATQALTSLPVPGTPAGRRALALARAEADARGVDAAQAERSRRLAVEAARAVRAKLAAADDLYLQALRFQRERGYIANDKALAALAAYEAWCKSEGVYALCAWRPRWRLQQLLADVADEQHAPGQARVHAQAALELAVAADDPWRRAYSESALAELAGAQGDRASAAARLARARALTEPLDDPRMSARLLQMEAELALKAGEYDRAQQALLQALQAGRRSGSTRLQVLVLANLSDAALRAGRPRDAMQAITQGLPLARERQMRSAERTLMNNAVIARVALGQGDVARREFDLLQAAWSADGDTGAQVTSMREYGDALAAVGDVRGAIEIHHRERELARRLAEANRQAALAELRTRYDRDAQERKALLLERDNALKTAQLDNQGLWQTLWALGAGVLVLTIALMLVLLRRVRETNRALEHSRARLRVQSERDALTGLANRRHVQAALHAGSLAQDFRGALMMIDIDHFKHINDGYGHAAGDAVLVEVARRIASVTRGDDIVARWGGEEFLILAPGLASGDADALAQRVLTAVGGATIGLPDGRSMRVTVSIGHGVFPLPPHRVSVAPEQAVNLADMALYTAKSQGRNRAVGIAQVEADSPAALRAVEADFERAWVDGRVQLRVDVGPPG